MAKGIIEAAVNGEGAHESFAYFFHGDQYIKYNWETDLFESGYPDTISKWNFPGKCAGGIDAAFNGSGSSAGKAYFFREDEYVRFDWANNAVDNDYPKKLSTWNLPGDFANGIDAAVNGQGAYKGKIYFFKGDQYLRYDLENITIDIGYPKPISAWNLPENFKDGVDAALCGKLRYEGKLYFFRQDIFISYDWATQKAEGTAPKDTGAWQMMFSSLPEAPVDINNIHPVFGEDTSDGAAII